MFLTNVQPCKPLSMRNPGKVKKYLMECRPKTKHVKGNSLSQQSLVMGAMLPEAVKELTKDSGFTAADHCLDGIFSLEMQG